MTEVKRKLAEAIEKYEQTNAPTVFRLVVLEDLRKILEAVDD